jgi:peroxiredoxin
MKKLFLILFIISAPFFSRAQLADTTTRTKIGGIVPSFKFDTGNGQKANISDYRGKIVMINFFATWCPQCLQELPRLQKDIWEKYKDNPKFVLLSFGFGHDQDTVLRFKEKNNYTFTMLSDKNKKKLRLFNPKYIPFNVVLDENGKIIYQSVGYYDEEFGKLLNLLDRKLK